MKIIAVCYNYASRCEEVGRDPQLDPTFLTIPDSALLNGNKPFFLPPYSHQVECEVNVLIRIGRMGRNILPKFAYRYMDGIGLGVSFTARDLLTQAQTDGSPWSAAKGFDGSAAVSEIVPMEQFDSTRSIRFRLDLNGETIQTGHTGDMKLDFSQIVASASRYFTLRTGDIIFCGTPAGVSTVSINDRLTGYMQDREMLAFNVK